MIGYGPDFWNGCSHCGTEYDTADPPPIVEVITDGDGVFPISFCSDECKATWLSD